MEKQQGLSYLLLDYIRDQELDFEFTSLGGDFKLLNSSQEQEPLVCKFFGKIVQHTRDLSHGGYLTMLDLTERRSNFIAQRDSDDCASEWSIGVLHQSLISLHLDLHCGVCRICDKVIDWTG